MSLLLVMFVMVNQKLPLPIFLVVMVDTVMVMENLHTDLQFGWSSYGGLCLCLVDPSVTIEEDLNELVSIAAVPPAMHATPVIKSTSHKT